MCRELVLCPRMHEQSQPDGLVRIEKCQWPGSQKTQKLLSDRYFVKSVSQRKKMECSHNCCNKANLEAYCFRGSVHSNTAVPLKSKRYLTVKMTSKLHVCLTFFLCCKMSNKINVQNWEEFDSDVLVHYINVIT